MPTAGRAAGAVLFALLSFLVARIVVVDLPSTIRPGAAQQVAAAFGALSGWRIAGAKQASGPPAAAARGVTSVLAAAFWTLLFGSAWLMLRRSLQRVYDDPVEALGAVASLMAELGRVLLDPVALTVLVLGGAACGIAVAAVSRRWP